MGAPKGNKYALGNKGGRPRKFQDPIAFDKMIDDFFVHCKNTGEKPTIEHLAVYMDTNDETLHEYADIKEFAGSYQKAKRRCLDWLINDGLQARNPVMHIFLAKNNYGYKDKQDVEVTTGDTASSIQAARERAKLVGCSSNDISQGIGVNKQLNQPAE